MKKGLSIPIVILLCLTFVSADLGKDALPKLDLEINGASISMEDNKIKSVSVTITNHGPSILKNDLVQINFCINPEGGYQVTGCSTKFVDLREGYCVQSGNVTCVMDQGDVSTFTFTAEFFNSRLKPGKYIMGFGIDQLNGLKNYEEINKDNNGYQSTFKIESKTIVKPPETIQPEVKEAQPQQTPKSTRQTPKPTSNKFLLSIIIIIINLVIVATISSIFLFSKRRLQTKKTKCRHCGAKMVRGETFCPQCGKGQTSGLINFFMHWKNLSITLKFFLIGGSISILYSIWVTIISIPCYSNSAGCLVLILFNPIGILISGYASYIFRSVGIELTSRTFGTIIYIISTFIGNFIFCGLISILLLKVFSFIKGIFGSS